MASSQILHDLFYVQPLFSLQDENNLLKYEVDTMKNEKDHLASDALSAREAETQLSVRRYMICSNLGPYTRLTCTYFLLFLMFFRSLSFESIPSGFSWLSNLVVISLLLFSLYFALSCLRF